MKQILYSCVAILLALTMAAALPTEADAQIYEDTLRLHILAASDSPEDQELKLEIRDRILKKYGEQLSSAEGIEHALNKTRECIEDIENDANIWLDELGFDYSAEAELSREWYDTRDYGEFSLPAGVYYSLRIIIDEGKGRNWWCIMYPPLCLDIATERAPEDDGLINYTKDEIKLVTSGKYTVKFKLLEIISKAFSKKG